MDFRILGPVEIHTGGRAVPLAGRNRAAALAVLLLDNGKVVSTERLIAALWDDDPPATARRQAQNLAAALRRELAVLGAPGVLEAVPGGYRIAAESLDTRRLDEYAAVARAKAAAGRSDEALTAFESALGLWRGPALAGLGGQTFEAAAVVLNERRWALSEECLETHLAVGDWAETIAAARALLAEQPYRQKTVARLMTALHRAGRTAEALEFYGDFRARLIEELGIEPVADLRKVHRGLLCTEEVPVPGPRTPVPAELPAASRVFVGRSEELAALDGLGNRGLVTLLGMPGVGKTALAVHWAHRNRTRFPDGQLYADLRGFDGGEPVPPLRVLWRFLKALGYRGDPLADLDDAVAAYRSRVADRRMIVILDNAADTEQVRPLLPSGPGSLALVTSRGDLLGLLVREGAVQIRLRHLRKADSVSLLARVLGPGRACTGDVQRLAGLCEHLPLALRIAGAKLAADPGLSVPDYLADLERDHIAGLTIDGEPETAVASTLARSYAALGRGEQVLFRRLGLIAASDFPARAAAAVGDVPASRAAVTLNRLVEANMVERAGGNRFRLHDLLRLYAERRCTVEEPDADRAAAIDRLIDHYASAGDDRDNIAVTVLRYPRREPAWQLLELLRPDLEQGYAAADMGRVLAEAHTPGRWIVRHLSAKLAWLSGDYDAAIAAGTAALTIAAGGEFESVAVAGLGTYHRIRGNYALAREYEAKSLDLARQGGRSRELVECLLNVATGCLKAGDRISAENLLDEASELVAALDTPVEKGRLLRRRTLHRLITGDFALARSDGREALEHYRRHPSARGRVWTLKFLAHAYRGLGTPERGCAYALEALELARRAGLLNAFPAIRLGIADCMNDLGDSATALAHASDVLALTQRQGALGGVAEAWRVLAETHTGLGEHAEAIEYAEQAVAWHEKVGEPYHLAAALRARQRTLSIHADTQPGNPAHRGEVRRR